ncbi:hypothetical protein A3F66_05740 [candidate division TM6 bacterium RIFCSPHIGHO2_12_FULL_32_22]|nr:MAG: hypothetical protein A3F66_05740 [candidate division TM6 bacterium RIFCSPHIGHO2_12_FULL_32_22]
MFKFDASLIYIFLLIKRIFETIGVIIITAGSTLAVFNYLKDAIQKKIPSRLIYTRFRFTIAKATIAGLETMIAADVISTVTNPDYYGLGVILLLVTIRTILNYSLSKELNSISAEDQKLLDK